MPDSRQLTLIDQTLAECEGLLRSTAVSPAARELRVRHGALQRVVRGWIHVAPHDGQVAAMLECVLELRGQVGRLTSVRTVVGSGAPPLLRAFYSRTTRPPPRRDGPSRTTRPPRMRPSDAPPSSRRG